MNGLNRMGVPDGATPPEGREQQPQEFIMGAWTTKEELLELLNKDSRVVFEIDEHIQGRLYFSVPFAEGSE